jgi:MoxR-like ATPase
MALFIFTAGNAAAQAHLKDSISSPIELDRIIGTLTDSERSQVVRISEDEGLYAWGAVPGQRNTNWWQQMAPGDQILCVYKSTYHYVAEVITTFQNADFAKAVWDTDEEGNTWELVYLLTKPQKVEAPIADLAEWLNAGYQGFSRISDEKTQRIEKEFGSIEQFIDVGILDSSINEPPPPKIPAGITREHIIGAIDDFRNGESTDPFRPSTTYDLVLDDDRFPPKAIVALAAKRLTGEIPSYFDGGADTACFNLLRNLDFEVVLKDQLMPCHVIRLNPNSEYEDEIGVQYDFSKSVPNHKKLEHGSWVVVDSRGPNGVILLGYGQLSASLPGERENSLKARFLQWHPCVEAQPFPESLQMALKSSEKYNAQHAIRPISDELYLNFTNYLENSRLCLIGTWKLNKGNERSAIDDIGQNGAIAYWWSFVIPDEIKPLLGHPFYVYLNTGGETLSYRYRVVEYHTSRGSDGIESPWPEITDEKVRGKPKLNETQSGIFKTWFRVDRFERLDAPILKPSLTPVQPSKNTSIFNQNAFGFVTIQQGEVTMPPPAPSPTPYSLDDALKELFFEESLLEQIVTTAARKKNIILQGAPGVGKTFAARLIAYSVIGEQNDSCVQMVQFHQSYAYEDFVQGWRPTAEGGFSLRDGPFIEFCERAREDPTKPYVFIIDEINRGNLSRIFGELMMLIESDKREEKYAIPLTYSDNGESFHVPENIHLIGLMNTADRSLALVDYALRRRFSFFELQPQFKSPKFSNFLTTNGVNPQLHDKIIDRMIRLNDTIETDGHLGRGFRIGHSYFCSNADNSQAWYEAVIEQEIVPMLEEYYFDDPEKVAELREMLLL